LPGKEINADSKSKPVEKEIKLADQEPQMAKQESKKR
jgi:hypothetical protein